MQNKIDLFLDDLVNQLTPVLFDFILFIIQTILI